MTQPLLQVQNLSKTFPGRGGLLSRPRPGVRAVVEVDLAVARGRTLGVVGESGCGKSTLARMLVGLLTPSSGQVRLGGEDLVGLRDRDPRAFHRRVQFVFQDPVASLNPRKTVRQILAGPLRTLTDLDRQGREARIGELMQVVNLRPEFIDRYPHEFSGGQAQRIAIARALAPDPELLVLDEPVSALDVSVQAQVLKLLGRLQRELGLTYVFISHDLAVVEYLSDRVAVMYLGAVMEEASREDLFARPRHPYTRVLLRSVPVPGRKHIGTRELRGEPPDPAKPPPGCPFAPRCYRAEHRCQSERPPLEVSSGRRLACFFPDDSPWSVGD